MTIFEMWKQLYERRILYRGWDGAVCFASCTPDYVPCILSMYRGSYSIEHVALFDAEYMKGLKDGTIARTEPSTPLAHTIINALSGGACFPHSKIAKGVRIR
jgi:hypothetical protein